MESPALASLDSSGLYLLLPLAACMACAVSATVIYRHDPRHPANRVSAALVLGGAWWGAMQALWMHTSDPRLALLIHKAATPGWAFMGPLALHLMREASHQPPAWMRRSLVPLYAIATGFGLIQLATPWMHGAVVRQPWGWGFAPGPALALFSGFTLACVIPALVVGLRSVSRAPSPAERQQLRLLSLAIATPLVLTSATAFVLPFMGVQLPRLGPVSFGFLGAIVTWTHLRYGFSALAPGAFSREIVETLPVGVCLLDPRGRVLRANGCMAELAEVDVEALRGCDVQRLLAQVDFVAARGLIDEECMLRPLAEGAAEVPVAVSTSVMHDRRGLRLGSVLVVRDLREMVRLRRHLVTSGRMAAVGELAAGIAHEINNPMAYVRANLSHLRRQWRVLEQAIRDPAATALLDSILAEGRETIEESLEGVDRASAIVRDVKGFAHAGSGALEPVELDSLLADVLRMAEPQLRYRAELRFEPGGVPPIPGRPQELKQVFLNLAVNAGQAVEPGHGRVTVRTRVEQSFVIVEVEDDGAGIASADLERIFDPFFTTKPVGEGTGLGLAISHEILVGHGAEIFVDSEPGRGSVFSVRFRQGGSAALSETLPGASR